MNILVILAIVGVCVADKLPNRGGYSFPPQLPSVNFQQASRSVAPSRQSFSAPVAPSRQSFSAPVAPSRQSFSAPVAPSRQSFSAPVAPSRQSFSTPQQIYTAPRHAAPRPAPQPTFSAPRPAPRPTFSAPRPAPQPTFSAPRPAPQPTYSAPRPSYSAPSGGSSRPVIPILRDDRIHPEAGVYSFNLETGDGIVRQESGNPVYSQEGPVTAVSGSYSFTLPDGQQFELRYVADENGFQPESPFLPVAPAFPHPIPAHALEQIERGRREHEARARGELSQRPSQGYSAPSIY